MLGTLRQVIVPVDDVDAAVAYYRDELGLALEFQDGPRWAAFTLGELTLALAGKGEQPAGGAAGPALGVKVADLDAALQAMEEAGGTVVDHPRTGPHERRGSCRDRFGTVVALYEPVTG